jgi:putative membrane protein
MRLLINWLLSALALLIVAWLMPRSFHVSGFRAALWAALVIGLVNATLGMLLKIVTFPLTILTFGIFWFVINAFMLEFASVFAPGFYVRSFGAAFIGAIVLAMVNVVLKAVFLG